MSPSLVCATTLRGMNMLPLPAMCASEAVRDFGIHKGVCKVEVSVDHVWARETHLNPNSSGSKAGQSWSDCKSTSEFIAGRRMYLYMSLAAYRAAKSCPVRCSTATLVTSSIQVAGL